MRRPQATNASSSIANQHLKQRYDNFGSARFAAASKLWRLQKHLGLQLTSRPTSFRRAQTI